MEVSDADREAANSVLYCAVPDSFSTEGQFKLDLDKVAEAFAKHRATQSAEIDALRAEVERLKQETAEEGPYCQLCGSCGDAYCGCTHKCKYPDGEVVALKDTITQLRDRVAGLEGMVGSYMSLVGNTGYSIDRQGAQELYALARALLTQNEVG